MSDRWPKITNIFQEAKPDSGGTFRSLCKWILFGTLFLVGLRVIGALF